MVICFECSRETKEQLDELVRNGNFSGLSEAIAVAIGNQVLLSKSAASSALILGPRDSDLRRHADPVTGPASQHAPLETSRIPSLFFNRGDVRAEPMAPPIKRSRNFAKGEDVSQALWIFGQHNKLLPAKASCRALANLLIDSPTGVAVGDAARLVANHASDLGAYLQATDDKFGRQRDELLATAFPGRTDPDKGRIRYANQFVVGMTKQGQLTGLLVDFGLLNKLSADSTKVSLTEAGWKFALLTNPVLDGQNGNPTAKFAPEEQAFLLAHIASNVAQERSAYLQILNAVHDGNNNPEKLRAAFNKREKETTKNKLYFVTQRAGALSRMADLGLLHRERDGTRVRYELTEQGAAFLSQQ